MQSFLEDFPAGSGRLQHAPPFSVRIEDVVLPADRLQRLPIPAGARYALFSFDADLRVKAGYADTGLDLPVATSEGGGGSELNPAARRLTAPPGLPAYTHLCLRAASACSGSVSFYA